MAVSASIFALAVAIIAIHGIAAQVPAPAPGPAGGTVDCFTTLLNMSDCLPYVSAGSKDTQPENQCCPALAGLVESNPSCLCQLLSDPNKVGFSIDVDRAMKLPSACNVDTPPVSLCSLFGFPVGSASPAPAPAPGVQPPDAGGSTGTGTPGNSGNRASSINYLHLAFPLGLALAFLPTLL